ncbi:arabinosyltransferase C-terminal domain-containing protein [Nocardia tengchongensis]|uniref:arabinosyltransferase C-terminal domain-containing protein n=1 Tax=Nocardia tengchongensis TaxID=2055889 RepID=UPI0036B2BEBA
MPVPGQSVQIEYGATGSGSSVQSLGTITPSDVSVLQPAWRNLRVPLADLPSGADVVRIVASVNSTDPKQWIALTPPRVPRMQTLNTVVGTSAPVLMDWLVGSQWANRFRQRRHWSTWS